jgi:hypothetical protein
MDARKRFYHYSYYVGKRGYQPLRTHHLRDGDACLEVAPVLHELGYEYGGTILNYPGQKDSPLRPVDTSFLNHDDLLVLTTRPPLHDDRFPRRKVVDRGYTTLEQHIFDMLEEYFLSCTRQLVELQPCLAEKLPQVFANRTSITYKESNASYYRLRSQPGTKSSLDARVPRRTAGYLISLPRNHERDLNILCLFGIAGTETLIWSYLLRTKFPEKITPDRARFVMAEMYPKDVPPVPDNLSFADSWKIQFLLDIEI